MHKMATTSGTERDGGACASQRTAMDVDAAIALMEQSYSVSDWAVNVISVTGPSLKYPSWWHDAIIKSGLFNRVMYLNAVVSGPTPLLCPKHSSALAADVCRCSTKPDTQLFQVMSSAALDAMPQCDRNRHLGVFDKYANVASVLHMYLQQRRENVL